MKITVLARTYHKDSLVELEEAVVASTKAHVIDNITSLVSGAKLKEDRVGIANKHKVTSLASCMNVGGQVLLDCKKGSDRTDRYIDEDIIIAEHISDRALQSNLNGAFDHSHVTLLIEDIPKILIMLLNSSKNSTSIEKLLDYTKAETATEPENKMYNKWVNILEEEVNKSAMGMDIDYSRQVAKGMANHLISVFNKTTVVYTTSYKGLSYLLESCKKLRDNLSINRSRFNDRLNKHLRKFINILKITLGDRYVRNEEVSFSFMPLQQGIKKTVNNNIYGDVYSMSYDISLYGLSILQRNRVIDFEMWSNMSTGKDGDYYVPYIIENNEVLRKMWLDDMVEISYNYPMGMKVNIVEKGLTSNCLSGLISDIKMGMDDEVKSNIKYKTKKFNANSHSISFENRNKLTILQQKFK